MLQNGESAHGLVSRWTRMSVTA